ncbi:MAG: sugar ABC transporter permease [Firmicutes bacterium]|jgi:multiple sugar transport system permease protein|nr:sugar ABC transporter permease [Bacillota bacterium]
MRLFRRMTIRQKEALQGYMFVSPWIFGFIVFTAGPLLFSLYAAFTNYDITSRMDFVGAANFRRLFTLDPLFATSVYNTLYYVVFSVPLRTACGVLLAVMLNQGVMFRRVLRTVYYMPSVLSGVAVYLLWMQLLSPSSGLINMLLEMVGIQGPAWLFDPRWTKPALILMNLWGVGGTMLLYLANLQSVPSQLYEAAEIDGASILQRFFRITLPMITPVIFFNVVTGFIGAFQIFQEAYVMSTDKGGPLNSLLFYNLYLWKQAFEQFNMGYASAMAWLLFVAVMIITLLNLHFSKKWVYYEGGE